MKGCHFTIDVFKIQLIILSDLFVFKIIILSNYQKQINLYKQFYIK